MAAEQLSTAIKEEWSLTEEQVARIEAFTTLSDKPDDVVTPACGSICPNNQVALNEASTSLSDKPDDVVTPACGSISPNITIFVPTSDLLGRAHTIVEEWGIKQPSDKGVQGRAIGPGVNACQFLGGLLDLMKVLREKEGLVTIAGRLRRLILSFVLARVTNPCQDADEIWDVISIPKRVLHLGRGGVSTTSYDNIYGHIQLAVVYNAPRRSFACVYAYVHRVRREITDALQASGTPQRANSIRILHANLMANYIKTQRPELVNLVPSDEPYPSL